MIGLTLVTLLLLATESLAVAEPEPGTLEDCLAWTLGEVESAHATMKPHALIIRRRLLMSDHFTAALSAGSTPAQILLRQRQLQRIGIARMARKQDALKGAAARDTCNRQWPTPWSTESRR